MAESYVDMESYFVNTLGSDPKSNAYQNKSERERVCELRAYADIWMEILQEQLEQERYLRLVSKSCCSIKPPPRMNASVYNGIAGHALLDLFLANTFEMPPCDRDALFQRAHKNICRSLQKLNGMRMSFLGGAAGPLAIAIVYFSSLVASGTACEATVANLLTQLLEFHTDATCPTAYTHSEILCGRAGYLWALLYVEKHVPGLINPAMITQVVMGIVTAGQPCNRKRRNYLLYNWKGKHLLGAAHGLHGILYVLLKAKDFWPVDKEKNGYAGGGNVADENDNDYGESGEMCQWTAMGSKMSMEDRLGLQKSMFCTQEGENCPTPGEEVRSWVWDTLDFLCCQIFASGNIVPARGHSIDKHVNWAHGAPGAIYTFIEAHKIYGDVKFLNAALNCGSVAWTRGLSKTGYSLAEGVAGNAYALMALYTYTKTEKFRRQALMMAEYCFNYGARDDPCTAKPLPHQPLSLYEGVPGVIYMLYDFTTVKPKLPAYEL